MLVAVPTKRILQKIAAFLFFVSFALSANVASATTFPLSILNSQGVTIYVSFNQYSSGAPYQGTWTQTGGPSGILHLGGRPIGYESWRNLYDSRQHNLWHVVRVPEI
jgi:hypothetical protein